MIEVTKIEEEFGILCKKCLQRYYNDKANLIVCQSCNTLVDIILFDEEDNNSPENFTNNNEVYKCKRCRCCSYDLSSEALLTIDKVFKKPTFFQKIKNKLKWLKKKCRKTKKRSKGLKS